ncbi:MAG: hypothetical protein HYX27_24615 [Acidobacteria bacterium]|nr:hypothetical protein [Acidobacteriota bacterium]
MLEIRNREFRFFPHGLKQVLPDRSEDGRKALSTFSISLGGGNLHAKYFQGVIQTLYYVVGCIEP